MEGWQTNSFVMYGRLANKQFWGQNDVMKTCNEGPMNILVNILSI